MLSDGSFQLFLPSFFESVKIQSPREAHKGPSIVSRLVPWLLKVNRRPFPVVFFTKQEVGPFYPRLPMTSGEEAVVGCWTGLYCSWETVVKFSGSL